MDFQGVNIHRFIIICMQENKVRTIAVESGLVL